MPCPIPEIGRAINTTSSTFRTHSAYVNALPNSNDRSPLTHEVVHCRAYKQEFIIVKKDSLLLLEKINKNAVPTEKVFPSHDIILNESWKLNGC